MAKFNHTFFMFSMSYGFPRGNEIDFGNHLASLLIQKHIVTQTMH